MSESKNNEMVINYVPGEECRVAVVEDGKLEEFHAERADAVSHVGNIYVGKVRNVEPAIQAAFIDFGLEQNGFLHVSDLHPQYFPGEGDATTEMVGKKTPRRERPPIQECLRRGQEIAVQVLKEGVGTKGPTVTSYLSIPGRFLVMMPSMDRVGVSRKVEDEETRRKMREILDQLELPEGFGFIVRTAGMERTKAELKRDLAYLGRLWKDIEKRWSKGGNKPRLLYSESDLLMRALRDMVTTDLDRIVIDDESAVMRAARFLKIVAPRTSTKLVRYTGRTPIFHSMGIEEQIRTMYSREVPLPSGGRLVIDETEALVAIDVNSGKMRDARDAETNAYRTNLEAAEEICRQLKLRDVGGIVVNDLIDMRSLKHRREIEQKFKELLKKDRARTTLEQISQFGILEMTRQRMRGSYESVHFGDCPTCRGRGLVQRPDSVATDAMRELGALLEHERVARIEMSVSPRIAGELLSSKRRALNRLERVSGKHVEVRVSETVPVDRVNFYCYDDRGADIDTSRLILPRAKNDELMVFELPTRSEEDWTTDPDHEAKAALAIEPVEADAPAPVVADPFLDALEFDDTNNAEGGEPHGGDRHEEQGGGRRRRRRRGRGRGRDGENAGGSNRHEDRNGRPPSFPQQGLQQTMQPRPAATVQAAGPAVESRGEFGQEQRGEEGREGGGRRRRRRRRGRGRGGQGGNGAPNGVGHPHSDGFENGRAPREDDHSADDGTPIFEGDGEAPREQSGFAGGSEPSSWDVDVPAVRNSVVEEPDVEEVPLPAAESVEGESTDRDQPVEAPVEDVPVETVTEEVKPRGGRRRRGRGRGRGRDEAGGNAPDAGQPATVAEGEPESKEPAAREQERPAAVEAGEVTDAEGGESMEAGGGGDDQSGPRRRRRRGRGRGRGDSGAAAATRPAGDAGPADVTPKAAAPALNDRGGSSDDRAGGRSRGDGGGGRRGGRGGGGRGGEPRGEGRPSRDRDGGKPMEGKSRADRPVNVPQTSPGASSPPSAPRNAPRPTAPAGGAGGASTGAGKAAPAAKGPVPRVLYSSRRKLLPSERSKIKPE